MNFFYKGVVFDWAWTLIDLGDEEDYPAFVKMSEFFQSKGFEVEDTDRTYQSLQKIFWEQVHISRECGIEALFEVVVNYLALEKKWDLPEAIKADGLEVYYREIYRQRRIYPDVIPTLEALKNAGIKLGIVSNTTNPGKMKRLECELFGLNDYFDFGIYSSEVPFRKPHPSIFKLAIAQMELNANEILFVGDSFEADIVGASNVGMATAWLNRKQSARPSGPQPDFELTEVGEVLSIQTQPVS